MTCLRQCQCDCACFQDVFSLQPCDKDHPPALEQAEKDDVCDKLEELEKAPRKMLSRGEWLIDVAVVFVLFLPSFSLHLVLTFPPQIFQVGRLKNQSGGVRANTSAVAGSQIFPLHPSFLYIINTWSLIDKHCFQKLILKSLCRRIYAHCRLSHPGGCRGVGVHAFQTWPDAEKMWPSPNYSLLTIISFSDAPPLSFSSYRMASCRYKTTSPFQSFLITGR